MNFHNMSKFPTSQEAQSLSPAQMLALKRKLRALRWRPDAVLREVVLIQRLREIVCGN